MEEHPPAPGSKLDVEPGRFGYPQHSRAIAPFLAIVSELGRRGDTHRDSRPTHPRRLVGGLGSTVGNDDAPSSLIEQSALIRIGRDNGPATLFATLPIERAPGRACDAHRTGPRHRPSGGRSSARHKRVRRIAEQHLERYGNTDHSLGRRLQGSIALKNLDLGATATARTTTSREAYRGIHRQPTNDPAHRSPPAHRRRHTHRTPYSLRR